MSIRTEEGLIPVWLRASLAVLPVTVVSFIGQWVTYPNLTSWYMGLVKPPFNPPNYIFAPVWTTLFFLMAYSVWRILSLSGRRAERRIALVIFYIHLALNALWSCLFFGFNNPLAGLIDIVPQFVIILITINRFRRLDLVAALCLTPLALWVGFASLLNFEIWRLNI